MPYTPGRTGPPPNGSPMFNPVASPSPNLQPPAWNPGGLNPAVMVARGMEAWTGRQAQQFAADGLGNQVWTWWTPLFNLRPGLDTALGIQSPATPINHEGALGLNVFLNVMFASASGLMTPPALLADITVTLSEYGNPSDATDVRQLTPERDVTDDFLAGGTNIGPVGVPPYPGASVLNVTPSQAHLRYWQVRFTLTIVSAVAITNDICVQATLH